MKQHVHPMPAAKAIDTLQLFKQDRAGNIHKRKPVRSDGQDSARQVFDNEYKTLLELHTAQVASRYQNWINAGTRLGHLIHKNSR